MKALVTGATGFIGGNLVRELLENGFDVRVLVRATSVRTNIEGLDLEVAIGDLADSTSLARALDGCHVLFHAAAAYTFWTSDPAGVYRSNVEGTRNILLAAQRAGIEKIVYTSTESTIGIAGHGLGTERTVADIESLAGDYKKSKLLAERLVLEMCDRGMPITIVNPTMPLGPHDVKPTPTGQVLVDFLNGKMPAYVNTGLNVIDVNDLVKGHVAALEKGRVGERYILGHVNLTLRDLLGILESETQIKASNLRLPIWLAQGAAYIDEFVEGSLLHRSPRIPIAAVRTARKFRHFDCSKAIRELSLPQTPIEGAIQRAVAWFTENGYVHSQTGRA
jgi:dihydroflavonol-4-reductase